MNTQVEPIYKCKHIFNILSAFANVLSPEVAQHGSHDPHQDKHGSN